MYKAIRLFDAKQIQEWDAFTIKKEPISPEDLMRRASSAFVVWFVSEFKIHEVIGIVCGKGNNGGDGLVIAELLKERGYHVTIIKLQETSDFDVDPFSVIIDAIFGTGLSRPVEGLYRDAIRKINEASALRIAVDVPSGLMTDTHSTGDIVNAHHTVTFQIPKVAFMFPENAKYVGDWHVVDIGLSPHFIADTKNFYVEGARLKNRDKFSHKGDYGRALLIAGSLGKMGACVLAARAALRSGAGLLTVHVPKVGYNIIQTSVPEAMATIDAHEEHFSDIGDASNYAVIGIGPGIGVNSSTVSGLRKALQFNKPMVLDADALNILSNNREIIHLIPPNSILTPHPGEFERLAGKWTNDFHRLELQRKLAIETKSVVVLKGAQTSIAAPDGTVWFNSTGNPGMAKGGSGDVLTGILTGLLSQGYPAPEAAIIGVYIHGLAGDLAAAKFGQNALLAGDIVDFLGQSFGR